jgi:mannose-6-phosphate isomerase-like protein (cupin superfamily)
MRSRVERVDKPWGFELRFVRVERFAGKVLFIKAGHQLSLQYHERKEEAFLVHDGRLELVLGSGADQRVERLGPGEAWHVTPGTIHRFRAVTDCHLFEVSTPELDDVVRIEDDYGRQGTSDTPAAPRA